MATSGRVSVKVVIDDNALARMQRPGGQVNRYTRGKAHAVAAKARQFVPVRTGKLRNSIKVDQSRTDIGRFQSGYDVAADTAYARFVHDGTRPHTILGNPLLVFQIGSQTIFTPRVNHPGTRARPFLVDAARAVMAGTR